MSSLGGKLLRLERAAARRGALLMPVKAAAHKRVFLSRNESPRPLLDDWETLERLARSVEKVPELREQLEAALRQVASAA